jgi:hypothetical protein
MRARGRIPALALVAALACALAACGKRGSPMPPLPRGPLAPEQVRARQIGSQAVVTFEVPGARGERPSQDPVRAELVRVTYPPGTQVSSDPDVFRRRGDVVDQVDGDPLESGTRARLEDADLTLPASGNGETVRYAVRVRDRKGRPSPLVVAEDLVLLPPAPPPAGVRAMPTADGMRLEWTAPPDGPGGAYTFNVYRTEPGSPWPEQPLNSNPLAETGFLDPEVVTGERYAYTVRAVLEAQAPYREGAPSLPCEVLAEDRFPPAAPEGLVAVQEGLAVRLFWNPNAERDLVGYRVDRRAEDESWTRVGPARIEQSSFLDAGVRVGQRLAYRVTAVDRAEPPNESAPSAAVEIEVLAEPVAP